MKAPTVKVQLTEEQKRFVPDWEKQVSRFQRRCDERTKDKHQRFRLCLHEGAHALQIRKLWDVNFHGPYVAYKDGELHFVAGAVSPMCIEPLYWQHGMIYIAGFWTVEHFTAVPNDQFTIQNDLDLLRSELGENADINQAVHYAEVMLEAQLSEPNFIQELERAVRDYELDVYGTDEATRWGWQEYHPELEGARHRVVVPYCGCFGTLVDNEGNLKLIAEGEILNPEDNLRSVRQEVVIAEPQKVETHRAVQRWNDAVRQMVADRTTTAN